MILDEWHNLKPGDQVISSPFGDPVFIVGTPGSIITIADISFYNNRLQYIRGIL